MRGSGGGRGSGDADLPCVGCRSDSRDALRDFLGLLSDEMIEKLGLTVAPR
jgi:hypothetical protein